MILILLLIIEAHNHSLTLFQSDINRDDWLLEMIHNSVHTMLLSLVPCLPHYYPGPLCVVLQAIVSVVPGFLESNYALLRQI